MPILISFVIMSFVIGYTIILCALSISWLMLNVRRSERFLYCCVRIVEEEKWNEKNSYQKKKFWDNLQRSIYNKKTALLLSCNTKYNICAKEKFDVKRVFSKTWPNRRINDNKSSICYCLVIFVLHIIWFQWFLNCICAKWYISYAF